MKIFITDLAAYNNGDLVGDWCDLPMDEKDLDVLVNKILVKGQNVCEDEFEHEEIFITDYECEYMNIDEYESIYRLNEIAELMHDLDEYDRKKVKFLLDYGVCTELEEAISICDDVSLYENTTLKEVAEDMLEELYNVEDLPYIIKYNIDYEGVVKDIAYESTFIEQGNDVIYHCN